jgi:uncharacterized protein YxjI
MKKSNFLKNKITIGLVLIMVTIGLTSMTTITDYDPTGVWDYEVETEQGTLSDKLTISKGDDGYEVSIETAQYGTLELENVKFKGTEITANIDMQGAVVDFEFEFEDDTMKGTVTTPDGEMDMTAKRRKD